MSETAKTTTLRRSRRLWIILVVVVVLLAALAIFAAQAGSAAPAYRTATAEPGDVTVTLDAAGAIQPIDRADLAFPVAGRISAVEVTLGQQVAAGTVVARLDTTELDARVAAAESQLATARATLAADEDGTGTAGRGGGASAADLAALQAAQQQQGQAAAAGAPAPAAPAAGTPAPAAPTTPAPAAPAPAPAAPTTPAPAAPAPAPAPGAPVVPDGLAANPAVDTLLQAVSTLVTLRDTRLERQRAAADALARAHDAMDAATAACVTADQPGSQAPGPSPEGAEPSTMPDQETAGGAAEAPADRADPADADADASPDSAGTTLTPTPDPTGEAATPAAYRVTAAGGSDACLQALGAVLDGQSVLARLQDEIGADDAVWADTVGAAVTAVEQLISGLATQPPAVPGAAGAPTVPTAPATPAAPGVPATPDPPPAPGSPSGAPAAPGASAVPTPTPAGAGTADTGTGGAPAGGQGAAGAATGGGGSGPASPEQLDADRAAVDAAEAELTEARQNLAQAVLTTPVDGTVGMLELTVGQQVSGGSATPQAVVIAATRSYQVDVSVSEADVLRVAVGNPVTVTPDGSGTPIEGIVSAVGLLPTTSSTGAVSYPITVALPGVTGPYPAGQGAAVAIRLAAVTDVLTVPTSAVHTDGATQTVAVLRGGIVSDVPVRVGAVGALRTEIVSGLAADDQVVIADPTRPLPSLDLSTLDGPPGGGGG